MKRHLLVLNPIPNRPMRVEPSRFIRCCSETPNDIMLCMPGRSMPAPLSRTSRMGPPLSRVSGSTFSCTSVGMHERNGEKPSRLKCFGREHLSVGCSAQPLRE